MALYSARWQQFLDHLYRNRSKKNYCRGTVINRGLRIESLEERRLLSVSQVYLNSNTSKLTFVGSDVADTAIVSESIPGIIDVSFQHDGQLSEVSFNATSVSSIVFYGNGGDDSFTNLTSLNVLAFGNAGNDYLQSSTGVDVLNGDEGDDILLGGGGDDVLRGGEGNDILFGEAGDDFLSGNVGDDWISGQGGHDRIYGNSGDDRLEGGEGDDLLWGDTGHDIIEGHAGNDQLDGAQGADILIGDTGNDVLNGGTEDDYLIGGSGEDLLGGGSGNDQLEGGEGDDLLNGHDGNDRLIGGANNDRLNGGNGNDSLAGGTGDDRLYGDEDDDHLAGDDGQDYLQGGLGDDHLLGGEGADNAYGNEGNDILEGGSGNDALEGGDGSDQLHGGLGDDLLRGSAGNDLLLAHEGADRLYGDEDLDILLGGEGDDYINGGTGNDYLSGGTGSDFLTGDDGDDSLYGGANNDSLFGGLGSDTLAGGDHDDKLHGNDGADIVLGGDGHDQLHGENGTDRLFGGSGDDYISGGNQDDELDGGSGEDFLAAGAGNDVLHGQAGVDVLYGANGDDTLNGGLGDDKLYGELGDDLLIGDEGNDQLYGEGGADQLYGGIGDDYLNGGNQDDHLDGGSGADFLTAGAGNDILLGQEGNDALYGSGGNDSLFGGTGNDNLFGEDGDDLILGDEGADLLSGDLGNDLMSGGQGEDELIGSAGQDVLIGGGQIDRLTGGTGEDLLVGTEITHDFSALSSLHAIWGTSASFARRINDIQDSETLALQMNVSVVDDHVVDQVFGGTESDWILLPGIHATYDPFGSSIPHDSPEHDHSSHSHSHDGGHGSTIIDHPPVVEGFALIDSLDNLGDLNDEDVLHTVIPHASEPSKRLEHLALFELVRYDQVTHTVAESGDWSDPSTWKDERMPSDGARILVPVGIELNVDRAISAEVATIRVDGTLRFSTDGNSELRADTIVVSEMGRFQMGTATEPVQEHVTAKLVFTDDGAIDRDWDPFGISRGLITHGAVEIHGAETTAHVRATGSLTAGATSITLQTVPVGWKAGDQIVIAGSVNEGSQSEQRTILLIVGNTVYVEPLDYDHALPTTAGGVHVANLTRNVVLTSEAESADRRGHTMFMHNRDVRVSYATFDKLGRTDKLVTVNDAVVDASWNLEAGTGTNDRARYAIHFHRNGVLADSPASQVHGSVVTDNVGWGYVNHSSYVDFTDNVAYDITGAGFSTEVGDEIGSFVGNIAIDIDGTDERADSRRREQDFGHGGDGFWFQGSAIRVVDNIAADAHGSAFFYYSEGFGFPGDPAEFPTEGLEYPYIADGADSILSDHVPVLEFRGNQGYSSARGLTVRYHLRNATHDFQSVFEDSQFWNNETGVHLPYSQQIVLRNLHIAREVTDNYYGNGVSENIVTHGVTYEDLHITGYYRGIDVARRGTSIIHGGYYEAIDAIVIGPSSRSGREVIVQGDPVFGEIAPEILGKKEQTEVRLRFDTVPNHDSISYLFSSNSVTLNYGEFDNQKAYYSVQLPGAVPFPEALPHIPTQYVGLTNQQLSDQFGLRIAGEFAPENAVEVPSIGGLVVPPGA